MTLKRFYLFMTALYLLLTALALTTWAAAGAVEPVIAVAIVGPVLYSVMFADKILAAADAILDTMAYGLNLAWEWLLYDLPDRIAEKTDALLHRRH